MSEILIFCTNNPISIFADQWEPPNQYGTVITAPSGEYDLTIESIVLRCAKDLFDNDGEFTCNVYEVTEDANPLTPLIPTGGTTQTVHFHKSEIGAGFNDMTLTFTPVEIAAGESKAFIFTYPDYEPPTFDPLNANRISVANWQQTGGDYHTNYGITTNPIGNTGGDWFHIIYSFTKLVTGTATPFDPNPPSPPPDDVPAFPPAKPALPNADPWWDPPDPPVPSTPPGPLPPYWATGGGGYQKNLVVSGNNKIYYEPHTEFTVPYTP